MSSNIESVLQENRVFAPTAWLFTNCLMSSWCTTK